jgi:hypothetical protein
MKTAKRFILSLSALLLISGLALGAPVSARAGTSGVSGSSGHDAAEASSALSGNQTETEVENHAHDLAEQFRSQAKTELDAKKSQVKEHTQEQRQKSCEGRKTNLTKRMANAVTNAQNHKAVFDKIYTRVKTFHDTKNLDVPNYAVLTANADTAQANAAASITALQQLDVNVDCTSQTVADSVSAFQQAVKNARDSLKTYRASITELIKAVKAVSASADNQTNN